MSAHTPGPWSYEVEGGDQWWFDDMQAVIRTENTKHFSVAVMAGDTAEEIANAKLIAAAPELLAALVVARQWICGDVPQQKASTLAAICAAIAKATGEAA